METHTDVLLVTANVGSLFDNVSNTGNVKSKIKNYTRPQCCQRIIRNAVKLI